MLKKYRLLIIIGIFISISIIGFFLITGRERTDVYLGDFELSADGKTMTLKVGVSSSAGYIKKMKKTSGSMNYYLTFYSTFGINSKIDSKDTFVIDIDNNVDEIYFYTGRKGYKKVLELNDDGEWIRPDIKKVETGIENINAEIYDTSQTGTTIVITDNNKNPYTYGEGYKIEKEENGQWTELKPLIENYAFISIAYYVDEDNKIKFIIDWEWLYGKLPYGSYRIVKDVGHKHIYIPFSITATSKKK